ncbi:MAG TPA: holo-[acyl-carrier-protein] synthase [Aquificaceae bacterium]|nr:holo-[acyl-carrier-protein] synthase [Aquificaceae bacterium]HIQ31303.1 holo-[acyl-carrier-protein] synthase [Aquifex aeolicus]
MVGIDVVRNERIREALERFGERFLRRIYTEREVSYCTSLRDKIPCLAARWACKEAVLKAFYAEFGLLLRMSEIEVLGKMGEPPKVVIHHERAKEVLSGREVVVSLSHERDYSVAVALIR